MQFCRELKKSKKQNWKLNGRTLKCYVDTRCRMCES